MGGLLIIFQFRGEYCPDLYCRICDFFGKKNGERGALVATSPPPLDALQIDRAHRWAHGGGTGKPRPSLGMLTGRLPTHLGLYPHGSYSALHAPVQYIKFPTHHLVVVCPYQRDLFFTN
jgi:hypothetical protein